MVRRNIPTFPRIEKALRAEASPLSTFYVLGPVFVLTGKILGSQEWLVCASFTKEIVFDPRTETWAALDLERREGTGPDPWVKSIEQDLSFYVVHTQKNSEFDSRFHSLLKK